MHEAILALTLVVLFMTLYSLVHLVVFRVFQPTKRWVVLKRMYIVFIPFIAVGSYFAFDSLLVSRLAEMTQLSWPYYIAAFVMLMLLHVGYLMFYAFIDRSLSIRTNFELFRAGNEPLTHQQLVELYKPAESYSRRIQILKDFNYLKEIPDTEKFTLTSKGLFLAKGVWWLKNLYKLGPGG